MSRRAPTNPASDSVPVSRDASTATWKVEWAFVASAAVSREMNKVTLDVGFL